MCNTFVLKITNLGTINTFPQTSLASMSRSYPDIYWPDAIADAIAQLPPMPTLPDRPKMQVQSPQVVPLKAILPLVPLLLFTIVSFASQITALCVLAIVLFVANVALIGGALLTYPQRRKQFEKNVQQYEQKYQHYIRQVEQLQRIENDPHYQSHLTQIQDTLNQTVAPAPLSRSKTAQKGVSETQFLTYLNHYFPGQIYTELGFKIPRYKYPYTPDFCYVQENLHIDIEIDEPYVYKIKRPYHCYPDERETQRHAFFLARNWIIIRFAEEQVCRYPQSCCKAIAQLVSQITRTPLDKTWTAVSDLKPVPRWDEAIARSMVKSHYRNTYLRSSRI